MLDTIIYTEVLQWDLKLGMCTSTYSEQETLQHLEDPVLRVKE